MIPQPPPAWIMLSLFGAALLWPGPASAQDDLPPPATARRLRLPAFSEEREAAALHFVKKQVPDLLPILEKLKSGDAKKYQEEIRELFHLTELLADLREDDEKRYELELEVWKTETKALILVARMASLPEEEQEKLKEALQEHTKKLVDLDMQVLKLRIDGLEKELGEARDELSRGEERRDIVSKERYEKLVEQAKRRGMMK